MRYRVESLIWPNGPSGQSQRECFCVSGVFLRPIIYMVSDHLLRPSRHSRASRPWNTESRLMVGGCAWLAVAAERWTDPETADVRQISTTVSSRSRLLQLASRHRANQITRFTLNGSLVVSLLPEHCTKCKIFVDFTIFLRFRQ